MIYVPDLLLEQFLISFKYNRNLEICKVSILFDILIVTKFQSCNVSAIFLFDIN